MTFSEGPREVSMTSIHKIGLGIAVACAALGVQPAAAQQAATFKSASSRSCPARRRSVRRAGAQRRRADDRSAQCRQACPRPMPKRASPERPIETVIVDEAGGTTKQVTEYRNLVQRAQRRCGDRLHLQRRLPRDGAGRRGAEEAHGLLRLRHAAHFRGCELQISVPHRRHRRRWTTWPPPSTCSRRNPT